jgi:prepilin-type N-terminal cleavage/methylation domain-containing protein
MTDSEQGFTLLEVLIALTITAMVLGGLFALAAGSKQLAVRTQDTLAETAAARAAVNFAMLDNQFRDIQPVFSEVRFNTESGGLLEDPPRRTQPMNDLLESYQLIHSETGEQISGVRWVRSDLPR